MEQIGIVCASDLELAPFLKNMEITRNWKKAMLTFYEGRLEGTSVVAVSSGVCKVNAAIAAQILIDEQHVYGIISAGTAGGMSSQVRLFDTVVGEYTAYHDVDSDILTKDHPHLPSLYFSADDWFLRIMKVLSQTLSFPILFGRIVTGEQFITYDRREEIYNRFSPLAEDMESAGIAHVCYVNQISFISVKTITDSFEHRGLDAFDQNCEQASVICAGIVSQLVARLG